MRSARPGDVRRASDAPATASRGGGAARSGTRYRPRMPSIPEDHRYEQFFFDDATAASLTADARTFDHPLLVGMPSLAERLEEAGHPYALLDQDRRLRTLRGHRRWDLHAPEMIFGDHDAIFCDPPFANIALPGLEGALDLLARGQSRPPALFLVYISDREAALLDTFRGWGLRRARGPLGYRTVPAATQARIHLYRGQAG
jgi:hypothetical protein